MRRTQHGTTLLEMLVACLLLALGVVGTLRLHGDLRRHAELSRQRHEAVRLAQQDLERLRAFATLASAPGLTSWTDVADASEAVDPEPWRASAMRFTLTRSVREADVANARQVRVEVAWTDRFGSSHAIVLDSLIAGHAPSGSAALALDATGGG